MIDYYAPKELIATAPASPRDSAKLMVYDRKTKEVSFDVFRNIEKYLPENSLLIFNDTKVLPARIELKKEMGGSVKILCLGFSKGIIHALADRLLKEKSELRLGRKIFLVQKKIRNEYFLRPKFRIGNFELFLRKHGLTPLPPYIKSSKLTEHQKRREYQTIFARHTGSVAAPTASLHFTKTLMKNLRKAGHEICFVTLHVGLGTFAPITQENLKRGKLHEEHYEIPEKTLKAIARARKSGRKIIAVGTTVARTLESAFAATGKPKKKRGNTSLFIRAGYPWKIVDGLITNFHVPQSSLLLLVAAFTSEEEVLRLYGEAIDRRCKLFSFGDGMMIL